MASKPPVPPRPGRPLPPRPGGPQIGARPPLVPPKPQGLLATLAGIESVAELGSGGMNPIWLVTLKGGLIKMIVKLERQFNDGDGKKQGHLAQGNIKAMNNVMKVASPSAAMGMLDAREVDALNGFAGTPPSLKDAIKNVKLKHFNLVKMKYDSSFASHSNAGIGAQGDMGDNLMSDKDKADAKSLLEALRGNRKAWQTLGQVVIADALIGNSDRVDITNGGVTNFGNLIFSRKPTGEVTHALGYDSIDPSALGESLLFGQNTGDWEHNFGRKIKDKTGFVAFAGVVIRDINKRRMTPLGLAPFGHAEAAAFAEGMVIGWDKQANAIGSKVRMGQGVPSGIMSRAKFLGWVK